MSVLVNTDFDIAVIGSGFGGSLLAMIARRLGLSVVLLERGRHPRFVIGESSTPLASLLLEEMAQRYDLPRLRPLAKWGVWQRAYPQVACGLKRGFTFFHHRFDQPFVSDPDHQNQLLVAASPRDEIADTHWYRPDFDAFLVAEAQAVGVEFLDETKLDAPVWTSGGVVLAGTRNGRSVSVHAKFVIDASGPRGFLHQALQLPEASFPHLPPTQALHSHFTGVRRWEEIFPSTETPPYPVDDAALHHVFDGGWMWGLRFNNGITSAGVAARESLAKAFRFAEGEPAWDRLLRRLPSVREQFVAARPAFPFVHAPRLSFRSGAVTGERWALLPSAAGFVDPLLSTGFPLTLLGVSRLAHILEREFDSPRLDASLAGYEQQTLRELDSAAELVAALYAHMNDFALFAPLSLLYFAAASFTETARRLGRATLAGDSFLLGDHPQFGPRCHAILEEALRSDVARGQDRLVEKIFSAIDPVDVAGLGDRARRNWHGVEAADLFNAAARLGVGKAEIEALLARCGLFAEPV